MNIFLQKKQINSKKILCICGSKSESNRLLLLQALFPSIHLENLSTSDDTKIMMEALKSPFETINIHHAGTAMRFLTAFFSIYENYFDRL